MPPEARMSQLSKTALVLLILLMGCSNAPAPTPTPASTPTPAATPTPDNAARVTAVTPDKSTLPNYESLEMILELTADYTNPYDAREITVDGLFTAPDGQTQTVPAFWDGQEAWRLRFTPSQVGDWQYEISVQDVNGRSQPHTGQFTVTPSEHNGWLQAGNWVNPEYSGHYLVHHDGTPFYGIGHADALNILIDGFNIESGVGLFDNMLAADENYVVWWPFYTNSPVNNRHDDYSVANMGIIDLVVQDAQAKGIYLIFTIWDHPQLRDNTHAWGTGNWQNNNGFRNLGDINTFFTDAEAWAWQENLYRYLIARWGYSPAIGMWQLVSEINGTNAYEHTDAWHDKVNAYFVANDPYRHPTTASMAGDVDWEAGHNTMDAPQVHVYDLDEGPIQAAETIAYWTRLMYDRAEKPNWIGEFGVPGNGEYPELFHHSIWAALANGAAMTPAEWNSGGNWGRMTPEMNADIGRLATFVNDLPLAHLNPAPLELSSSHPDVRAWGLAGTDGGLLWAQDFSQNGRPATELRTNQPTYEDVTLTITGLADGTYTATPYDTWQGVYLEPQELTCTTDAPCTLTLPSFQSDIAVQLQRP